VNAPHEQVYLYVECPVCGYPGTHIDHGPYQPHPLDEIGGLPPVDPRVHYLTCGLCGKGFDAAPNDFEWAQCPPSE